MMFEFTPQLMLIEGNLACAAERAGEPRQALSRQVHALVDCPPVAHGLRYLLVGRNEAGRLVTLGIGRAVSYADTLNLAEIRHRAATLGACQVHVLG